MIEIQRKPLTNKELNSIGGRLPTTERKLSNKCSTEAGGSGNAVTRHTPSDPEFVNSNLAWGSIFFLLALSLSFGRVLLMGIFNVVQ